MQEAETVATYNKHGENTTLPWHEQSAQVHDFAAFPSLAQCCFCDYEQRTRTRYWDRTAARGTAVKIGQD